MSSKDKGGRATAQDKLGKDDKKSPTAKSGFDDARGEEGLDRIAPHGLKVDGTPRSIATPRTRSDLPFPHLPPNHSKNSKDETWNSRVESDAKAAATEWLKRHRSVSKKQLTSLALREFINRNP